MVTGGACTAFCTEDVDVCCADSTLECDTGTGACDCTGTMSASCAEVPCCPGSGLICDDTQHCALPYGSSCEMTRTSGPRACASGLTCDDSGLCLVSPGGPCTATENGCANGEVCTEAGVCGVSTCVAYDSDCSGGKTCCSGLACDTTSDPPNATCYYAEGAPCGAYQTCAGWATTGDTCFENVCVTCVGYGVGCAEVGCCAGLTCDATYGQCAVAHGSPCTANEHYCANGGTCTGGVCD